MVSFLQGSAPRRGSVSSSFPRVAASSHLTRELGWELSLEKGNAGKSTAATGAGQGSAAGARAALLAARRGRSRGMRDARTPAAGCCAPVLNLAPSS